MSSMTSVLLLTASLFGAEAVVIATTSDHRSVHVGADATQMMRRDDPAPAPAPVTATINLYYETRCPDCIEFINGTLAPLWRNKEMRGHLNVTVNPYGNAMSLPVSKVSKGYSFWHPETTTSDWSYVHICQHGTEECLGNLIQACAIKKSKQEQYMELILCMADKPDWSVEKSSYECMQKNGIDTDKVKDCVNSPEGNNLLADFGKSTGEVKDRKGTPWVMVNGVNVANPTDLLKTVCTHVMVKDQGPDSCKPFAKADAPAPAQAQSPDFTVLPALKKKEKQYIALSRDQI